MSALSHAAPGAWRRRTVDAAVLVVLSAVVAVAMLFASRFTAHSAEDVRHLEFGLPVSWVTQDQYLSPASFPYVARFLSPWEHPVAINPAALVLNSLVLLLALWVGLSVWRLLRSPAPRNDNRSAQTRGAAGGGRRGDALGQEGTGEVTAWTPAVPPLPADQPSPALPNAASKRMLPAPT